MKSDKVIMCFGNSLTAGYGFIQEFSYPGVLQKLLDSHGQPYEVINLGISGETSNGGVNRIEKVFTMPIHIFILELGINDALRGMPLDNLDTNLRRILEIVKRNNPKVHLVVAGMEVPLSIQNNYIKRFLEIYPQLAKDFKAILIPFFLKDVAGVKALNLPDGLHPNKEGYRIIGQNVYEALKPLLHEPSNS